MRSRLLLLFVLASATLAVLAQSKPAGNTDSKSSPSTTTSDSDGARLYREHCARCHRPPDDLSPHAVRAVLRHMRVRANLRAQDEQALLKYLAPGR